ncbi:DddA-like double-stranded DNA deaminase toxin [Streptomyces achromogenes]|uniref:DddA-like double-stranded DNA deaminase toxin n=1 Tax=Streptomyces achromogenes TaxID=67255 RepID=UPI003A7F6EA4
MRALGIGRGTIGLTRFATQKLPKSIEGGSTVGIGASSEHVYRLISGNKKADADLIDIVNKTLRKNGVMKARRSARASDVEQKMAAIMIRDEVSKAEVVINNPSGPCRQPLGCDQVLDSLLGERELTVHWPDGKGIRFTEVRSDVTGAGVLSARSWR